MTYVCGELHYKKAVHRIGVDMEILKRFRSISTLYRPQKGDRVHILEYILQKTYFLTGSYDWLHTGTSTALVTLDRLLERSKLVYTYLFPQFPLWSFALYFSFIYKEDRFSDEPQPCNFFGILRLKFSYP